MGESYVHPEVLVSADWVEALNEAKIAGAVTYISPITAWEVGMLAARDRVKLLIAPQRWFARLFEAPEGGEPQFFDPFGKRHQHPVEQTKRLSERGADLVSLGSHIGAE